MPSRAGSSFLRGDYLKDLRVSHGCQCPHGLVAHFYPEAIEVIDDVIKVSMPSRASTSFLLYASTN